jgi:hypothetical protein
MPRQWVSIVKKTAETVTSFVVQSISYKFDTKPSKKFARFIKPPRFSTVFTKLAILSYPEPVKFSPLPDFFFIV